MQTVRPLPNDLHIDWHPLVEPINYVGGYVSVLRLRHVDCDDVAADRCADDDCHGVDPNRPDEE